MIKQTKAQCRRKARYQAALRESGFRSWLLANRRRSDLIDREIEGCASADELAELERLQRLADCYIIWKTNDATGRSIRRLTRLSQRRQGRGMTEMYEGIRAADRLAYQVAKAILRGSIRTRTGVSDALEDYLEIGGIDGPKTVPEWVERYEAAEAGKITIVTAPAELIEAGQRATRKAAEAAKEE